MLRSDDLDQKRYHLHTTQEYVRALFHYGKAQAQKLHAYYTSRLAVNDERIKTWLENAPVECTDGWESPRWLTWEPTIPREKEIIRVGDMLESLGEYRAPAYVPFIGQQNGQKKTIIIRCTNDTTEKGLMLLQSLVIRIACMLPNDASFRLLDPIGLGSAFLMQRYLLEAEIPVEKNGFDIRHDLNAVYEDIQSINGTMLTASITSFEQLPHKDRVNWRYQFIFAADFPYGYDERAITALQHIGHSGPRTGVYVFIHWNQNHKWPNDEATIDGFVNPSFIDMAGSRYGNRLRLDQAPSPKVQEQIFTSLKRAKKQDEKINWEDTVAVKEEQWWQGETSRLIETPIGLGRGGTLLNIGFGQKDDGQHCTHGVLAGMPGSGKSSLCHVLICGLAQRYSPEDLHLYLIDGKNGVGFKAYEALPHARVISLHSSAELSRSVLEELVEEMERRHEAYFKPTGVENLFQYYRAGQQRGNLPRILLVIDEYQELFEEGKGKAEKASNNLRRLAMQGRSAGIHLFLVSQQYTISNMQYRKDILNNIHTRLIMKMTSASIQTLEEFGPRGKRLIQKTCTRDHMVVIQDEPSDEDSAYRPGSITYLPEEQRMQLVATLAKRAKALTNKQVLQNVILDGTAQPELLKNPQLHSLLTTFTKWPTAQEMEDYAQRPERLGGLGDPDWYTAESPRVAWLGQEFSVHGYTRIIFRRHAAQNALLVGEANHPRYGMLAVMLAGLAVSGNPHNTKFVVMDYSPTGRPWSPTLQKVYNSLPPGFSLCMTKDSALLEKYLEDLLKELQKRQLLRGEELLNEPSIFLIMTEPDSATSLKRQQTSFGLTPSPLGTKLFRLLQEGPERGIHLILSFANVKKIDDIIDLRSIRAHCQHLVGLTMSENDFLSLGFVQSRNVSELQRGDSRPICALYMNTQRNQDVLFKPYCTDNGIGEEEAITDDIKEIGDVMHMWS